MTFHTSMLRHLAFALGLGTFGSLGLASVAEAQETAPSRAAQRPPASRQIRIGEFKIEGQIQKPQAFYILQRSNLNFEGLELKNSFVPKIIKSVEQAPF